MIPLHTGILLIAVIAFAGCTGQSLGTIRQTEALRTGTFDRAADPLAVCARERLQTDQWQFGQPVVSLDRLPDRLSVHAWFQRGTLFELKFIANSPSSTRVEYRRSYDGHGTEAQAWSIVEACSAG